MSDILSQDEVDALLTAVSSGNVAVGAGGGMSELASIPEPSVPIEGTVLHASTKQVGLYDFRRPDRVSKDQIRTLENLHEGFARLLSTTLSSMFRNLVEIDLISVDQLTYQEVIMSISSPSCIYIFQMEPLESSALIEINPSLVFTMLDRMFGGQGRSIETNRELTDIEKSVLNKIMERILMDLKEVWENIGIFSPKIEGYETSPLFVQIAPPGETIVLISLEVKMRNGSGLMSLCFPFVLLESIIDKLSGESWISSQKTTTQETRRLIEKELSHTPMTLRCQVGETKMNVRDFLQLNIGDVLVLDKLATSDLTVFVEDRPEFLAKPGVVGRNKSIQITSIIEREVGDV
ncbi:MAG: flagellar motor switch protein FliM [Fibrobacter sp.]|nr:flagellar motor switch protein FliM [Fibrobacter sp.]